MQACAEEARGQLPHMNGKGGDCWVVAIACAANGWHQPLTIGSHHFQWLGNLPCLTLQPCLTAEQVEQHHEMPINRGIM